MIAVISSSQATIITAALTFLSASVPVLATAWWKSRIDTRREMRKVAELEAAKAASLDDRDLVQVPAAYRALLDEIRQERTTMREELKRSGDQIDLLIEQLSDAQHELANAQAALLREQADHEHTRVDLNTALARVRELEHELRGAMKRRNDVVQSIITDRPRLVEDLEEDEA